jgi:ABC-type glycerol-3-phosphate transport system substrate-binding protein
MNLRPFEIILIAIFSIGAIAGLVTVTMFKAGSNPEDNIYGQRVMVWGTFEQSVFDRLIGEIKTTDKAFSVVSYKKIDERSFEGELLNAIAEGNSPDLVLVPHTMLASYRSKFTAIPLTTYPERTFKDTYVDGANIFMMSDGIYGIPLAVDPLVLYWNRNLFANAGLANPPKTWESLVSEATPALTEANAKYVLSKSAIGLGEFINITHAKEILSMLFLQSGTTIVEENQNRYRITLNMSVEGGSPPGQAALLFFTQFASPGSPAYTWNRSRPFDRMAFTGGSLAMYIGFASERKALEDANPNLSFDMAPVPQSQGATAQRNYGTFYAFGIPKASKNATGAYKVALRLTTPETSSALVSALDLTPVHRSLYTGASSDQYSGILRQSGLIARGWLDPDPERSESIFKKMVEDITSARAEPEAIMSEAAYSLEALFR